MGWWSAFVQVARNVALGPVAWGAGDGAPVTLDLEPLSTFDTAPRPVDMVISAMKNGDMVNVSRATALSVAAVQRGRNDICSISTLPLKLYRGLEVTPSPLFRQFDPDVPNVVHMALTIEDLAFDGIAWWQITGQDFDGYPASVRRLDPCKVSLTKPGKSPNTNLPGIPPLERTAIAADDARWVWINREDGKGWTQWPAALMIRFDSPNPGILKVNARAIRIAIKLDRLTEMYAENPALREFFTDNPAADVDPMEDDEIDRFLAEYGAMRQTRPFGWIPGTVVRSDVSAPSPKDLTLADLQEKVTLAIANGLGVDPEDLGVSTTSRTYQNAVDRKQDKINRVYAPYMSAITDRLGMGDVTRRGYAPRFDLTDYLKSDPVTQAAYWKALQDMGVVDAQWIGDQAGITSSVVARASAAARPAPAAPAIGQNSRPAIRVGDITPPRQFAAEPLYTFGPTEFAGDPAPAPTVDQAARTITGLAVPYGAVADKYGIKITFDPGSLEYSSPERMAHMMDHGTPVGFHRSITDTPAGPMVALAVLDGPEGSPQKAQRDGLLYDAANGLYSGLSIGVAYSLNPEDGDVEIDDDGVYHVVRATWRETSSTYMPAFDDARVTQVAASLTGGTTVDPCQHCGHRHAPNIGCRTFAAQLNTQPTPSAPAPGPTAPAPNPNPMPSPATGADFAAFQAWVAAGQNGAPIPLDRNGQPQPPLAVNPHHGPAQVTEPTPYRFDRHGNLRAATHDFSSDLLAGWRPGGGGDLAARDRAEAFLRDQYNDPDPHQFAITPANVVNLNYPANKPDMYVDQMEYQYPIWNAINKGTLDTVTPFVIPKFNSSSGLVADHVTGTEPTPGAFTATAQTITPSAVSGKVEITREAFDQGGNPQMSGLIYRQMTRGYFEALEAYAVAQLVLVAASMADLVITTAAADSALDQAIASALIPLKYIRGGDRFRNVYTQIDLYTAMVKAKDSNGRRLYPSIGAQNAVGTVDPRYDSLDAHGKLWYPAWATAATGTVAQSSYMFDPEKVCGWASAPQRIDITWRVAWVDMGIWGYKAFGVTDFAGTRELVYDPV
jgi:hypothetical protein